MYFEDLTPYEYMLPPEPNTYNIGWLDEHHGFSTGEVAADAMQRLLWLCLNPDCQARCWHPCPFCRNENPVSIEVDGRRFLLGDAEIRVEGRDGKRYAAPNLIYHYVKTHRYRPPEAFVRALLGDSPVI